MPRPVLPRRCRACGERVTLQPSGYWLCDPAAGGCGWSDDPGTVQPQAAAAPQVVERSPASEPPAER